MGTFWDEVVDAADATMVRPATFRMWDGPETEAIARNDLNKMFDIQTRLSRAHREAVARDPGAAFVDTVIGEALKVFRGEAPTKVEGPVSGSDPGAAPSK